MGFVLYKYILGISTTSCSSSYMEFRKRVWDFRFRVFRALGFRAFGFRVLVFRFRALGFWGLRMLRVLELFLFGPLGRSTPALLSLNM